LKKARLRAYIPSMKIKRYIVIVRIFTQFLIVSVMGLGLITLAHAHPHVWVHAKSELIYASDGKITHVRQHWTFDEAYSAFAVQGLDKNKDGIYSTEELSDLAKTNAESLVDFGYFTFLKVDGKIQPFATVEQYTLDYTDKKLTLHFTLPLKEPSFSKKAIGYEVYDPTFFVAFEFHNSADALVLKQAPQGCLVNITRPTPDPKMQEMLSKFSADVSLAGTEFGVQMASKALVVCP
jgi:ABC-type uncharacterized transport system substrate-binding protein